MKTLYLDVEHEYNFDLYGMVSPCKEYKLAWALNRLLDIHLIKKQDIYYDLTGKNQLVIANYLYSSEFSTVRLFRNRALGFNTLKKPFLLPDMKEYDYILQVTGALQQLYPQELIKKLQRISLIQYVKQFDPLTLKFKENLLL
ncbi:IPExxxVDY family protein [Pontibacter sp. SGAir0037]|uniref:IPExxxVDY family protein n=1 Tax=Pontibacter sp. SGAir0037 TaxID=2571030 RepID=UPI0010CCCF72|nr:IPExxxVDY family protein [Pontibacter sp. SGAir0037]QCR20922.1 IPExxxVDY family protein [Pontibacter sp. SGAir0037]